MRSTLQLCLVLALALILFNCSHDDDTKNEQISVSRDRNSDSPDTVLLNSIQGSQTNQIGTRPNKVIMTGLADHRLIPIYKEGAATNTTTGDSYSRYAYDYDIQSTERVSLFMPGIDLIQGYNLLNIAHYDVKAEKLHYLFEHPVLVRSFYYPSYVQDSLYDKPINRDYYLVSAYDADTNGDTLINKLDLRRFYYFNIDGKEKSQLVPPDYSIARSQYDPRNDIMYIFARHDANKNGTVDDEEPLHVFWIRLNQPTVVKRMY